MRKILFITFGILLLITTINCYKKPIKSPSNNLGFLKVERNKIVDENGNKVLLHGFNVLESCGVSGDWYYRAVYQRGEDPNVLFGYGRDLLTYFRNEEDTRIMKTLGVNIVRLWFTIDKISDTLLFENQLENLDQSIEYYGKNGIYVLLVLFDVGENDNPACRSRRVFHLNLWEEGRGSPIWNKIIETWGIIARRYKDNPYVAGYDFLNEPKAPNQEILYNLYADIINEIRTYDHRHIVFPETDEMRYHIYDKRWTALDNNLVVNHHFYQPWWFTKYGGQYPGEHNGVTYNLQWINNYFNALVNHPDIAGKPVMITEFGFLSENLHGANGSRYMEDEINVFNEKTVGYMYYGYKNIEIDRYLLYVSDPTLLGQLQNITRRLYAGDIDYTDLTKEQKELLQTRNFHKNSHWERILKTGFANGWH